MRRDQIDDSSLDIVLAPVASGLVAEFGADLAAPILLLTDATPAFLREFYGKPVPPEADATEARALSVAAGAVYSSAYMAERARTEFGLSPDRVHVIPFGLNLDHMPETPPQKPPLDPLNLLFIGLDWERKGGAIAIAALDALRDSGLSARLTVIGGGSPEAEAHPDVDMLGFLNKNDPKDAARLEDALRRAHLLVLPTRADCTPMVVAEANAYGCPVLITETGGIPTLMAPGNGQMLPLEADGLAWAEAIRAITGDPEAYRRLSRSSHAHCRERLTWEAWAASLRVLIGRIATELGSQGSLQE